MASTSEYQYVKEDFIFETHWNNLQVSAFDYILAAKWTDLQEKGGVFKYKLKIEDSKTLPGEYQYFAQLNEDRALLRRKPVEVQNMKQTFDPNTFNFTKMDRKEILFEVFNKEKLIQGNYVGINVSPLEFGHCLFLAALHSSLPQVVTVDSLLAAVELFLLSSSPALRMGFNSLCACASINHLHFHLYYLQEQMFLETIEVEHLSGACYVLRDFPSQGFVFGLTRGQDISEFVRNVFKLVNFLQENETPHNLFITRGTGFCEKTPSLSRDWVRVFVWARKPVFGIKDKLPSYAALCELFGHLVIKSREEYETLTEDYVVETMNDLTTEPFHSVLDQVRTLYK